MRMRSHPLLLLSLASVLAFNACSRPDASDPGRPSGAVRDNASSGRSESAGHVTPSIGLPIPFSEQCERDLPPTRISVRVEPAQLQYFNDVPLGRLRHNEDDTQAAEHGITLGNTHWAPSYSIGHTAHLMQRGEQRCMRPAIEVVLKPGMQTVNVAQEFRSGTCGYQHILDHEHRHVRANLEHIAATGPQLELELRKSFGNTVFYADSPSILEQRLSELLKTGWIPYVDSLLEKGKEAHRQIDTQEEYARNNTVCGGEIARITKAYSARRWAIVRAAPG